MMSKIVGRTLDFLEIFAEQKRPLSLSEIARLLEIPASSCHDVIQALQERGYVYELAPRGGYYPTRRLFDVAQVISDHDPVVLRADGLLRKLRDELDESVLLAKVNGLQATYLLTFEPSHPLRFLVRTGEQVRSLYATSAGRTLLASLDDAALTAAIKSMSLRPFTPHTISSKTELRRLLAEGAAQGWFLNRDESQEGVTTLSARFNWMSAVYIVTIAGPTSRIDRKLDLASASLLETCKRLEMQVGGA
jgi:DNA-binding IclR family transcriptional regulator